MMTNEHSSNFLPLIIGVIVIGIISFISYEIITTKFIPSEQNHFSENPPVSTGNIENDIKAILSASGGELSVETDDKFHWTDANDKTYIVPSDIFAVTAQSKSIDIVAPSFQFQNVQSQIRDAFLSYGYEVSERNTWYDKGFLQVQGYIKNDTICVSEATDYVMGTDVQNLDVIEISVQCSTKLEDAKLEQTKFVDALVASYDGEGFPEGAVYVTKQDGDYYKISVSTQPGGYTAYLKNEGSNLRVLVKTQEQLYCKLIEEESIPYSLLEYSGEVKCFEEDGAMRVLKSAL